jgi:Zn-dependent alcohol dehydrogenases, class III
VILIMRTAALFGCAVTSGFGAVNNDAQVKIGQSVLIFWYWRYGP